MRKPLFTTVEDFEQATTDLRPHFGKGIGLNALRTAIAKAHGFEHVTAYRQHLSGAPEKMEREGSTGHSSEAPNPNIFVKSSGSIVYLQGLIKDHDYPFSDMRNNKPLSHAWQEHISRTLTGTTRLRNVEPLTIGDKLYARGYFDITREDSYVSAVIGVRTFLEEQHEDSYGHIVFQVLFSQMRSAIGVDHIGYANKLASMGTAHLNGVRAKSYRMGDPCIHEIRIDRSNFSELMRLTFGRFQPYLDRHDGREVLVGAFDSSVFDEHLAEIAHKHATSDAFVPHDELVDRAYALMLAEAMGRMEERVVLEYWSAHRDQSSFKGDDLRVWVNEHYDEIYSILLGDFVMARHLFVDSVTDFRQRRL